MLRIKKAPNASLEDKRLTYILMGLVLAFAVFYVAFEWTESEITVYDDVDMGEILVEEEMIEQTVQEEEPEIVPPPATPEVIEEIQIVEDDVETADIEINSEDDQNQVQEIIQAPVVEVEEEEEDDDVIFVVVEKMPEYPGGQQALMKYFHDNIKYPVIAQENGIQGRVIVQFTVRKDGQIDDIVVLRSADPSLDKEAIRLVKNMPPWNPGKQRGKAVHCKFTVPVVFKLQM